MTDNTDHPLAQSDPELAVPDTHGVDTPEAAISAVTMPGSASTTVLGFRPQDRRMITALMFVLLLWLTVEWIVVANRRPDPLLLHRGARFRANFRVNVNESLWVDWMQLEGIGPSLAQRIVADRHVNGPFSSIEDVARVPGIGSTTLDRIRPWLTMGDNDNQTRSANTGNQRPTKSEPATSKRQPTAL